MYFKKTLLDYPEKKLIPWKVGKFLGSGAYGRVYEISNNPNKIIKLSTALSGSYAMELDEVFKKLLKVSSKYICKLYDFKFVKVTNNRHYFYYVAEKLIRPDYRITEKMGRAYSNRRGEYYKYLNSKKLIHCDAHAYNIMQNKSGRLKFIDLDSFLIDDE